jgi:hypothetical protein
MASAQPWLLPPAPPTKMSAISQGFLPKPTTIGHAAPVLPKTNVGSAHGPYQQYIGIIGVVLLCLALMLMSWGACLYGIISACVQTRSIRKWDAQLARRQDLLTSYLTQTFSARDAGLQLPQHQRTMQPAVKAGCLRPPCARLSRDLPGLEDFFEPSKPGVRRSCVAVCLHEALRATWTSSSLK